MKKTREQVHKRCITSPKATHFGSRIRPKNEELEVLELLAEGEPGKAIKLARTLNISAKRFGKLAGSLMNFERHAGKRYVYLGEWLIEKEYLEAPEVGHVWGKHLLLPEQIAQLNKR